MGYKSQFDDAHMIASGSESNTAIHSIDILNRLFCGLLKNHLVC